MKKFVTESLQEFLAMNEEKVKSTRKTKAGQKVVLDQSAVEKADQAIKALKVQLADAKKAGRMKDATMQKKAKVKEIEDRIAKWEEKKKKAQGKGLNEYQIIKAPGKYSPDPMEYVSSLSDEELRNLYNKYKQFGDVENVPGRQLPREFQLTIDDEINYVLTEIAERWVNN